MNLRKLSLTKETIFADAGRLISQLLGPSQWPSLTIRLPIDSLTICRRYLQTGPSLANGSCPNFPASFRGRLSRTGKLQLSASVVRSSMGQQ